jgi:hypothetical protein
MAIPSPSPAPTQESKQTAGLSPHAVSIQTFALLLAGIGLVSRLAPLLDHQGRVRWQFPTEDGYLMLTIARNMALGHGMSVADGAIATNGTQPLATALWAVCFWLADASKFWGVFLVQVLEIALACTSGLLMLVFARRMLERSPWAALAPLAAAAWFASPVVLRHSMNCLESGLTVCTVLGVLLALLASGEQHDARIRLVRWAGIGALLALAFWVRNDTVLLCGAIGVAHLIGWLPEDSGANGPRPWTTRVAELATAAVVVTLGALPWLVQNWLRFGHIVPISGQAESLDARFAGNLWIVPGTVFEYLTLYLPIPARLEAHPIVIAAASACVLGVLALALARLRGLDASIRGIALVSGVYFGALALFYGLAFGAGYFMSRYLYPASPGLALLWVLAVGIAWLRFEPPRLALYTAAVAWLVLATALHGRIYANGAVHEHVQVVEWVERNVAPDEWIGAVQTGTLGFFHDRTVNLDGKVNPAALEARRADRLLEYLRDSEIRYVVDWQGMAKWADSPQLNGTFEVIVDDTSRNLAVLRRKSETPALAR